MWLTVTLNDKRTLVVNLSGGKVLFNNNLYLASFDEPPIPGKYFSFHPEEGASVFLSSRVKKVEVGK